MWRSQETVMLQPQTRNTVIRNSTLTPFNQLIKTKQKLSLFNNSFLKNKQRINGGYKFAQPLTCCYDNPGFISNNFKFYYHVMECQFLHAIICLWLSIRPTCDVTSTWDPTPSYRVTLLKIWIHLLQLWLIKVLRYQHMQASCLHGPTVLSNDFQVYDQASVGSNPTTAKVKLLYFNIFELISRVENKLRRWNIEV